MTVADLLRWLAGDRVAYLIRAGSVRPVTAAEYATGPLPEASIITTDIVRAERLAERQRARQC